MSKSDAVIFYTSDIKEVFMKSSELFTSDLLNSKEKTYFTTGFKDIDNILGFIEKGSLITIGGRPAMGKKSFAISITNHLIEQNKKVLWFSLEITERQLAKQFLEVKTELGYRLKFELTQKQKEIEQAFEFYSSKELYINDKTNISVEDIEEQINTQKPDYVFIDYIQLVRMKAPNMTEAVNFAVLELKRIARETGVIFIILTQLSRALECRLDKRPILSDIRNTNLLEELSDVIMMIYREEYYHPDEVECKGYAEILIEKNVNNCTGPTSLIYFDGVFKNLSKTEVF